MTVPVVAIASDLPGAYREILSEFDLRVSEEPPRSEQELIRLFAGASAAITLLSNQVTDRVLASSPSLKIVANYAVGFDNIDVASAQRHGVVVTNTPGVLTAATADLTMALILGVTRRVIEGHSMVAAGEFAGWAPSLLLGNSLEGKLLGVVGMGRIGSEVARRAQSFGMEIIFANRSDPEAGTPGRRTSLDQLIESSDIITIHAPLNEESRGLFDERRLGAMKRGAYLINTARGPIVDESALAAVLRDGHLAGAGLDVYENEPAVDPGLIELDNVILLPHLGSATIETRSEMAAMVASDVARVLTGKPPENPVF